MFFMKKKKPKFVLIPGAQEDCLIVFDKINFINFRDNIAVIYFNNSLISKEIGHISKEKAVEFWSKLFRGDE